MYVVQKWSSRISLETRKSSLQLVLLIGDLLQLDCMKKKSPKLIALCAVTVSTKAVEFVGYAAHKDSPKDSR